MEGIGGLEPLRMQGITDRNGGQRKGARDAFRRALQQETEERQGAEPDGKDGAGGAMPSGLQRRGPIVRKDPRDGSLHVDLLA